jgi:hypothetical protein
MPFVKLDTGILDSSLWLEPAQTCKCWVTLLAMMDATGLVRSTAPGIAKRAHLTLKQTTKALETFSGPDENSRSLNDEGRRIKRVDGGYKVINSEKYRKYDYTAAERMKRHRERVTRNGCNETVTLRKQKQKQKQNKEGAADKPRPPSVEDWFVKLEANPAYLGIDIRKLHARMATWCEIRGLQPTLRRLVNWLNKEDKPMPSNGSNGMSPQHRQNRINFLNEKKKKVNRQIKDPLNPPSWAERELTQIDDELKNL